MLRVTGLSLLLGLAALVAMLSIVYLPAGTEQPAAKSLHWAPPPAGGGGASLAPETSAYKAGPGSTDNQPVALDSLGDAIIAFPSAPFDTSHYPFLHLALQVMPDNTLPERVELHWESSLEPGVTRVHTLETTSYESLWLATRELRGWEAKINNLQLVIAGSPNQTLFLNEFALYSSALEYQLRSIASDLTAYVPWNRSSMNAHTGARNASSFYPAILFAALWLASLGAYVVLCLLVRRLQFLWEVAGLITLGAWIALDLTWQSQLIQQAAKTRDAFAGKSTHEKLLVGPDAALYQFIDAAKKQIPEQQARVFSASSDDYTGLRAAYYFYPHNAFWSLHGDELPARFYLRSGDYLALLAPNTIAYDKTQAVISLPRGDLQVETLVSLPAGTLVKVK